MALGLRMHALRQRNGLTLETLAERVGVHKGHLSRIERGEKTPSVATLTAIAGALGVDMAELFGQKTSKEDILLVRAEDRRVIGGEENNYRVEGILPGAKERDFAIYHITPGPEFLEDDVSSHAGQKSIYVLSGRMDVLIAERSIELKPGDCLVFEASLTHRVKRKGRAVAAALVIVSGR